MFHHKYLNTFYITYCAIFIIHKFYVTKILHNMRNIVCLRRDIVNCNIFNCTFSTYMIYNDCNSYSLLCIIWYVKIIQAIVVWNLSKVIIKISRVLRHSNIMVYNIRARDRMLNSLWLHFPGYCIRTKHWNHYNFYHVLY